MNNSLDLFSTWYRPIHGYASLTVCLLGITLNFFNIIVLTRKHMLSSTNAILTALAFSDFFIMFIYIPTSFKFYCVLGFNYATLSNDCSPPGYEYFWTAYALFFVNFTVTMHSISIWLTVLLAFSRYIYICHNVIGKKVCSRRNTVFAILLVYLFCIILSIPCYLVSAIEEIDDQKNITNNSFKNTNSTRKLYNLTKSNLDRRTNGLIFRLTFVIQAFLVKLIPCILLIIFSSLLIHSIHNASINNKRLTALGHKLKTTQKSKEHMRTNIMLVLVCFLFFITEFPQGLIAFLSIIFEGKDFHSEVYMKLGDLMDIISLINNGVNFILYCRMSHIFRETFKNVFCLKSNHDKINNLANLYKTSYNIRDNTVTNIKSASDCRYQSCPLLAIEQPKYGQFLTVNNIENENRIKHLSTSFI
jgi:hypothetical protein